MSRQKQDKKRSINFTESEKRVLASEYIKHERILAGEFSPSITMEHKNRAWSQVADAVNAVAPTCRSLESVSTTLFDTTIRHAGTNLCRQM